MEDKNLDILLIEDNDSHLADARAEVQRRVTSGEKIQVDTARDLFGYFNTIKSKNYHGIVSDIFFPTSIEKPWENLANILVWDIMGKEYCEKRTDWYRCGDEWKEKILKTVRDDWMDGKHIPPAGIVIADEAMKKGIPIVFCTDTYHHGTQTQPVFEYAQSNRITIIDCAAGEGNSNHKNWKGAFDKILDILNPKPIETIKSPLLKKFRK
jgi:hypothetical protein